ncbi:hypothetical protein M8494_27460 [Serratia ureilytica]
MSETLSSNLLKSNCLVTNQPDWGSVVIRYEGRKIDRSLLRYPDDLLASTTNSTAVRRAHFQRHQAELPPGKLSVFARYTRPRRPGDQPFRSAIFERRRRSASPDQTVSVIPQMLPPGLSFLHSSPCYFSPLSSSAAIFKAH